MASLAQPATLAIGADGPAFEGLLATDGRRIGWSSFADRRAIVLVFGSNRCPTVKAYAGRLTALQVERDRDGVQVIALNSNDPHLYPDERFERMQERARLDGYPFPYVVDEGQRVARAYGPTCTFHVFLLDETRRLRYQGRFDDARLPENVHRRDLIEALDDVLAGRAVRVPVTKAFGCALDYV